MLKGFVVYDCRERNRMIYFSEFVNNVPKTTKDGKLALIFETREMAEQVAEKCREYTGSVWKVCDLEETLKESVKARRLLDAIFNSEGGDE